MLTYANDIDTIASLKESFTSIEEAAKEMELSINKEKIKVLVSTTSRTRIEQNLTIGDYNFDTFKYLGTNINNENNISKEIKQRITAASRCTHGLNILEVISWAEGQK